MALSMLAPSARACDEVAPVEALVASLDEAERSLSVLDIAAFKAADHRARELLPCLGEPVPRHVAAWMHRVVGLGAFGERDPLAPLAFAAARRIEPAYLFPRSLVPRGSPVLDTWVEVPLEGLATVAVPTPAAGWIELDGRTSTTRVPALPAVFQRFEESGAVAASGYLLPGEELPPYAVASVSVAPDAAPIEEPSPGWERARVPLAATAGGAALIGGTLWGLSVHGRARYLDATRDPVPDAELRALQSRTNALAAGSYVGAGLAAVSGALLLTTW